MPVYGNLTIGGAASDEKKMRIKKAAAQKRKKQAQKTRKLPLNRNAKKQLMLLDEEGL